MRTRACPRLFEAEAMRDGRLVGSELASFGRHLTVCPLCLREVQALDALAERLRAAPDDKAAADELRVLRERTRLLAAFDRELLRPERRWGARLLWPAAVAALVAGVFIFSRARPAGQPAHPPRAVVHADSTAVWSERTEGDREKVVLERGALWIHVDHSSGTRGLVVVLPDGELEDTGTTFTVSAENGQTTRVVVQEGSVVLRIRGQPPIAIGAGDTWIPRSRPAMLSRPSSAPPEEPRPMGRPSPTVRAAPAPRVQVPLVSLPDPSVDFRAATAALEADDNYGAAAAFATFLVRHPRDPRAEDAAYLRVISLQRCGFDGDVKRAAQEYVRRYPAGFRRAEVERLLR